MNKRQIKKIAQQGILKFNALKKDEICLIHFDAKVISPQIMGAFVEIWQARGFNNFQVVPFKVSKAEGKIQAVEWMEKEIERLKGEINNVL